MTEMQASFLGLSFIVLVTSLAVLLDLRGIRKRLQDIKKQLSSPEQNTCDEYKAADGDRENEERPE